MFDFEPNTYYSRTTGYIIDGEHFPEREDAVAHLVRVFDMSDSEADSYLTRLYWAFQSRERAATRGRVSA